jgi:tetratricopeptide (TPR) repeat protein
MISLTNLHAGNHSVAQWHAYEAWRLARTSADPFREARALQMEAVSWKQLGNYKLSISLCHRAITLVDLCGLSNGNLYHSILSSLAEIHLLKSEYNEAYNIHNRILQNSSVDSDSYTHAMALLNIANISVSTGNLNNNVQEKILTAKNTFQMSNLVMEVTMCDSTIADIYLREGDIFAAETFFKECITAINHSEIKFYCLEQLANVSRWGVLGIMSSWTTLFLAHSMKFKEKLGIYKALQFLGDIFLAQGDEDTAVSLFVTGLGGFTYMDVHCSRAECMLRLGDISKGHGDLLQAVEHWEAARPLFEKSSQTKQVKDIDERLTIVSSHAREQHRKKLALLEINVPAGVVEQVDEDLSHIQDCTEDLEAKAALEAV